MSRGEFQLRMGLTRDDRVSSLATNVVLFFARLVMMWVTVFAS